MLVKGLQAPGNITINFTPSKKQLELWELLQPNHCPHCGGEIEIKLASYDQKGLPVYAPVCKKCGTNELPQIILGGGSAGGGKMLNINSLVCTPFGFKPLKDIKIGDLISNPITGGTQRVIYVHKKGKFDFYRVHFVDGTYTDCSEGHLWKAHKSSKKSKKAKKYNCDIDYLWETKQMYEWYQKKKNGVNKSVNLIIPLTKPVVFTIGCHKPTIDPYILGALIGDGCMAESMITQGLVGFTNKDLEIEERFESLGCDMSNYRTTQKKPDVKQYIIKDKQLVENLKELGIAGNKSINHFIPRTYKLASIEDRINLMQGLIDTDGHVDNRGHITYTTISKQLAEDVAFIVRSLGGVATITKGKAGYKRSDTGEYVQCNDTYDVQIRTKIDPELCGISRKKERTKYEFNGGASELGKRITDVEYIGPQESFCISVSDPSGLYITDNFTVTHNSYIGSCWLIISCLRFPDLKAVVARKTLKALKGSTFQTIKLVLRTWGLEEGVNYKINHLEGVLTFYNGSSISLIELEDLPSDPEFERLGSNEWSIGFVDECSQISEKAVEVLFSRLRWNIATSFIYPRLLLTTNPTMNWVRSRFVQDEEGNKVKCKRSDAYVPFSVFDNPNESFVATYRASLDKISDVTTRNRLLYGNWDFVENNEAAAYWNFDGNKHLVTGLREKAYDPLKPLILSFDFNVAPYMSCIMAQIDYEDKRVYVLEEVTGRPEDKENNTPKFAEKIKRKLLEMGHIGGIVVTGDPAGTARSTTTEDGVNNYSIIMSTLDLPSLRPKKKLLSKQPAQKTRLEFINSVLAGNEGWTVFIELKCRRLTDDLINQRKEMDGSKSKAKVMDPKLGIKYEKYGHFSDTFDYLLVLFLNESWKRFNSNGSSGIVTFNGTPIYGTFEY